MDTTNTVERRWRRRKDARPQEILDAALAVFAQKGFAAARMEDIAQQAGITKGTLYLYFDSKEAIFKSLVRESIAPTIANVVERTQSFEGSSRDLLILVLKTIGGFLATSDRVVLPKIVLAEAGNFPELARFYRTEIIDKGMAMFEFIIKRGITRGEFRPVAPQHAVRLCIAPILLGGLWRTTFAVFDKEPYDLAGLIDTHIDVLMRGLAPESAA